MDPLATAPPPNDPSRRPSGRYDAAQAALANEIHEASRDPRRRVGAYLLLGELGRGGMGVVWRAWDERLRRVVALKTIATTDAGAIERFRREAEAVARLRHPNIVSIYDVGEAQGRHFLAMELVPGETLARRVDPSHAKRLALHRAVEVVRDVAKAVQFAHEKGVVHRDLKPQNILLDPSDRPVVLDFGLARLENRATKLTKTGAVMGTPNYMPPEQAQNEATPRSDVYGLGATLYHAIAGEPPFSGHEGVALMYRVLEVEPDPPSTKNARAAGDLETVCLRCLEKDPARRYETAAELAEELERWLQGEPILARPAGLVARLARRARRNKLAAVLAVAFVAAALLGIVVAVRLVLEKARIQREGQERLEEEKKRVAAEKDEVRKQTARVFHERAVRALGDRRRSEAAILAAKAVSLDDRPSYRATHLSARCGPWRRPRILRRGSSPDEAVKAISFSGELVLAACMDGRARAWDASGKLVAELDHGGMLLGATFVDDEGRLVALGGVDGKLRVHDLREKRVVQTIAVNGPVSALARSGKRLVAGLADGRCIVFNVTDAPEPLVSVFDRRLLESIASLALDARARFLVLGGTHSTIAARTHLDLDALLGGRAVNVSIQGRPSTQTFRSVAFTRRVCEAAFATESGVLFLNLDTPGATGLENNLAATPIALGSVGDDLALGTAEGTIDIFSTRMRTVTTRILGEGAIHAVGASGPRLVAGSYDGSVREWRLDDLGVAERMLDERRGSTTLVAIEGGYAVGMGDGTVRLLDRNGEDKGRLGEERKDLFVWSVSTSRDGRLLAAGAREGPLVIREVASGRAVATIPVASTRVELEPGGEHVWTSGEDGTIRRFRVATGEELFKAKVDEGDVEIALSEDGKRLFVGCERSRTSLRAWSLEGEPREIGPLAGAHLVVSCIDVQPGDKLVASGSATHTVQLHRPTGELVATLGGLPNEVMSVAFSPDGKLLAAAGGSTIKLWRDEGSSWNEVASFETGLVLRAVAFSRSTLACVGRNSELQLWPLDEVLAGAPPEKLLAETVEATGWTIRDFDVVPLTGQ